MKVILGVILFFSLSALQASEIILGAGYSWIRTNISGQNDMPLYKGSGISGDLEFIIPFNTVNGVSFFGTYLTSNQENTANGVVVEELKIKYMGAGMRIYIDDYFASASLGKVDFEDNVSGTVTKKITAKAMGYELGAGVRFRMTRHIGLTFAAFAMNSSLKPSDGAGFYADYGIWQFRGVVGMTFILPSVPMLK
jgi:hypothetical protein